MGSAAECVQIPLAEGDLGRSGCLGVAVAAQLVAVYTDTDKFAVVCF